MKILKSNPSITSEEIAKILKVSKRTILRDIEYLTNSKIIKREGGAFGGKLIINK
ncbi:MAG: HTH domain-containing protein [Muribaculaceae bacterium]|nr:HTH domain-containing protein [Muribaculaceae bacterium]